MNKRFKTKGSHAPGLPLQFMNATEHNYQRIACVSMIKRRENVKEVSLRSD